MSRRKLVSQFTQVAEITDHLYLCGAYAVDAKTIKKYGITCVVNATVELPRLVFPNVDYVHVSILDSPTAAISFYFDEIADKINSVRLCGGKTLVHCVAGVSRSASLCLAYLMKYPPKLSLVEAYNYVKERRPCIRPNYGFISQLVDYEKKLTGKQTVNMLSLNYGLVPDIYEQEEKDFCTSMFNLGLVKVGKQKESSNI